MSRPETENGVVPLPLFTPPGEDTGEVSRQLSATLAVASNGAAPDAADVLEILATKVAKKMGGGGNGGNSGNGGGDGPDLHAALKKQSRGLTVKIIAGLITAALSSYAAMKLTVHDNAKAVEMHDAAIVEANKEVKLIKVRVGKVEEATKSIANDVGLIQKDVSAMKKSKVDDLEKELEDAKRELRRRRRPR